MQRSIIAFMNAVETKFTIKPSLFCVLVLDLLQQLAPRIINRDAFFEPIIIRISLRSLFLIQPVEAIHCQ
jgi:hypothetical protein